MSKPVPHTKRASKSKQGIIGIDEVGRGPLAGPVTVCAFYIEDQSTYKMLQKSIFSDTIKDSKKLTKSNRINIYDTIRKNRELLSRIKYTICSRSAEHIDKVGITVATRSCVASCIANLAKQGVNIRESIINLDAGLKVPMEGLQQEAFIKGDERFLEIALASIMAKVSRDMHMERLAKRHSEYKWEHNAGYGTAEHRKAIEIYGITKYHRTSFLKDYELFGKAKS